MTAPEAFFLGAGASRRFAACWGPAPSQTVRGALLFVAPFAEEMNKSRRMVALTAAALAERGFLTLRIDLRGCGDSAGLLAHATWNDWIDDLLVAWSWLYERAPGAPRWLWSLRAGALLAGATLPRLDAAAGLLMWQPVLSGKQHLAQFLRLRVAADAFAIADTSARATSAALMQALNAGTPVDVAGYRLPPAIALPLAAADLTLPTAVRDVVWLEVDPGTAPAILPASATRIGQWQAAGQPVRARAVGGPPFWTTQEIEDCPALVEATVDTLCPTP